MSHRLLDLQTHSQLPFDILSALSLTVLCSLIVRFAAGSATPLSVLFGLPLLLFLPGYVFFTALFPAATVTAETAISETSEREMVTRTAITPIEALTLSVVGSVSLTMLSGFCLNFTPWGITLTTTVSTVCGFTLLAGFAAVYRRFRLPSRQQSTQAVSWPSLSKQRGSEQGLHRRDLLVTGISGFALLFGAGTAVYAVAAPPRGETHSQFHLLTEDENGTAVADDYPTDFTRGEARSLLVGITNNERAPTSYEVIAELQRVENTGADPEILDREELDRYRVTVQPENTEQTQLSLEPTMTGEQLRLMLFLYRDEGPPEPSEETAYRHLHLWIDVTNTE